MFFVFPFIGRFFLVLVLVLVLVLTGSQVPMPQDVRRILCRQSPQAESRSGSCSGNRRLGAPTARTAFEHVSMMEYAIQHRRHCRHVAQ